MPLEDQPGQDTPDTSDASDTPLAASTQFHQTLNETLDGQRSAEREFIQLQISFARHASRIYRIPFEKALLKFTRLYRQFGLPLNAHCEMDDANVKWKAFLLHASDDEQLCQVALNMLSEQPIKEKTNRCFSYTYHEEDKAVNIHFGNNDPYAKGPLCDERFEIRKAELTALFLEIHTEFPQAQNVRGSSWLYNMPKYRRLFPPTYTDKMGTPRGYTNTMSTWGQFFTREGGLRHDRVEEFLHNLEKAETEEELLDSFPLKELSAGCAIRDFYSFYGIS